MPFAVVAAVAAVLVRLLSLSAPARPDEAGYLLVAQHARRGGAFLYGDLWVDRPPLLIAFFRVADALGGLVAVRLLALVPVVLLVVAAGHAGSTLGGPRGGRWAAAVAAALSVSPLVSAPEVDGELLAAPLVMLGCALGLRVLCRRESAGPPKVPSLVLAGAVAGSAVLVKQNFADGLVLLAITIAVQVLRQERTPRHGAVLMAALAVGGALPVVAAVSWSAWWGPGPSALWDVLVAFRAASLDVIATQGGAAPAGRARLLAVIALVSGLIPLLGVVVVARARSLSPIAAGVVGMTGFATLSIVLGGSFWTHYLLQLVPAAALAAGLLGPAAGGLRRWAAAAVALTVLSSGVAVAVDVGLGPSSGCTSAGPPAAVSAWLRERVRPGDSAVVLYGAANTILGSGARPAYPYLWSLPVRTLDPDLKLLTASVSGPHAATWVVQTLPLHTWGLDPKGRLTHRLNQGYRLVGVICGSQILLRNQERR